MKYLIIILCLLFVSCKTSKTISEQTDRTKTIEINSRELSVKFDKLGVIDTTDLTLLNTGRTINKKDKKTGIKTSYRIKDNNLISEIEVPKQVKIINVNDTTTIIKERIVKVREQRRNLWQRMKEILTPFLLLFFGWLLPSFCIKF